MRIETVDAVSDELSSTIISPEWAEVCRGYDLANLSDVVWVLRDDADSPVFVVGVFKFAMVGLMPTMWIMVCKDFYKSPFKNLRELRELINVPLNIYKKLEGRVNKKNTIAHKFIRFVGFVPEFETENEIIYRLG